MGRRGDGNTKYYRFRRALRLDKEIEERTAWALRLDKELAEQTARAEELNRELERLAWARMLYRLALKVYRKARRKQ